MESVSLLEIIPALWPIVVGFVGLIFWLVKSYADIETLKEKVKVLYDLYNSKN